MLLLQEALTLVAHVNPEVRNSSAYAEQTIAGIHHGPLKHVAYG